MTAAAYTVKDVARIFGLQEARLRYWAQTGFVGPSLRRGGRSFYSFQDLLGVKVAKELLDGGVPLQRVRRNLDALRDSLPNVDRPLSQLRVCSDGERVVVVDDSVAFEPDTGQLLLSFTVSALTDRVAEVLSLPGAAVLDADATAEPRAPDAAPATAYAAFLEGLKAEEAGDHRAAEQLYRRATVLDEALAAAWTNLGNVLERRGARGEAREAYEKAVALDPDQPEARYNLANLLADIGEIDLAMAEYRRVTSACPEFADAHFNLAVLCARVGSLPQARLHLTRYLDHDADGTWAEQARALLASLEG